MFSTSTLALAQKVGAALAHHGWTMTTVESCTGGLVAGAVTAIAGSSEWFQQGFVTYSNSAKESAVSVPSAVLRAHGAVSEQTARAMAEGGLMTSGAQLAVSITGIAGPGGAVPGKPVGTVCFGWAWHTPKERGCVTETCHFDGDRGEVRGASVDKALDGLTRVLGQLTHG
jgi:nicotinamide-nucleotide amidase